MAAATAQTKRIRIVVDNTALGASVAQANAQLAQLGNAASLSGLNNQFASLNNAARTATQSISAANNNLAATGAAATQASTGIAGTVGHLAKMTLALAGIGFLVGGVHALAEAFIEASNEATEVASRLALVTNGTKEFAQAQANVAAIAGSTRSNLTDVAELYQKIGIQAAHLGASQQDVTTMTRVFAETLKVSGSTTQQAQGAMRQLGEAFDMNTLQGRHFMAMQMDNIRFVQLLAASMGVSQGKLKELAHEGKVTGEQLKKALTDPKLAADLQRQFDKMPVGFADVRVAIQNTLAQIAGDIMSGAGLNDGLKGLYNRIAEFAETSKATFIQFGAALKSAFDSVAPTLSLIGSLTGTVLSALATHLDLIVKGAQVAVTAWLLFKAVLAGQAIIAAIGQLVALEIALGAQSVAAATAGVAMKGLQAVWLTMTSSAVLLGGALTAVAAGLVWFANDSAYASGVLSGLSASGKTAASDLFDLEAKARAAGMNVDSLTNAAATGNPLITQIANSYGTAADQASRLTANARAAAIAVAQGKVTELRAQADNLNDDDKRGVAGGNIIAGFRSTIRDVGGELGLGPTRRQRIDGSKQLHNQIDIYQRQIDLLNKVPDSVFAPPKLGGGAEDLGKPKKDKVDEKAKREKEFWQTLRDEVEAAKAFGIQAKMITEEQKLQKILGHDITTDQKTRIDTLVQEAANNKAITELKQATFDLDNKNALMAARRVGLTEDQSKIEDQLDTMRLAAANAGVNIASKDYQLWLAKYRVALETNQAIVKQNEALKNAVETAKTYSAAFAAMTDVKAIDKQREEFDAQWKAGNLPQVTVAMHDAVIAGLDQARLEAANKPWKVQFDLVQGASPTVRSVMARTSANDDFDAQKTALVALRDAGKLSPEEFKVANREIATDYTKRMAAANNIVADQFVKDFTDGIDALADIFGGALGDAIHKFSDALKTINANANGDGPLNKLANMFGSDFGGGFNKAFASMNDIPGAVKNLSKPLDALKDAFSGPQGSAIKGLGAAIGGAMAGYQIGSAIGGVGQALGLKHFADGAKIGGAIGGLTGNPIIAAAASVVGGLIQSIFYKAPAAGVSITDGTTKFQAKGNNGGAIDAVNLTAESIQKNLQSIASQLGGSVGTFGVSIGKRENNYRVLAEGGRDASVKYAQNNGTKLYDGTDEAKAIAIAVQNAIEDGAIIGLSDVVQKALKVLGADGAIAFAQQWNSVMQDMKSMLDPIGSAVDAIITPLKSLRDTMVKVGASTEDLNKIDQYRQLKLDQALKDQLSSIRDFLKALNGDNAGVTKLSQLNADQAKFADYQTRIAAGDSTVNQSDFTSLGNEILSLTGDVYGTATKEAQDIFAMLRDSAIGLEANITTAFNKAAGDAPSTAVDSTTTAINAQTDAIVGQQVITNDLLRQMLNGQGVNGSTYNSAINLASFNGRMLDSAY